MRKTLCALLVSCALASTAHAGMLMKPTYSADIDYKVPMLQGKYDQNLTHPDKILGFEIGQRVASPAQIDKALGIWKTQSKRMQVTEYARSHEDRPLHAVFISSEANLAKLDEYLANIERLSDPRSTSDSDAQSIIKELPAVAWMAYSIHGNETSGADAALTSIYHLAASQESDVIKMLDEMIIVIDPMMNPDGRARFAKSLEQYRGTAPNVDDQSLLHRGDWPYGRTNHYYFDLNRDFFYLTQPETQGRVKLINKWRPQLMIDGHEMGPQDTYLMGPAREPKNFNIAPSVQKWAQQFSLEQGAAFDQRAWRYYTGEWFENLYPGYSNYAEYRGSMHILYEQSRMAEDGVRRPEGTVQTYKESVHHQFVSTLANLQSLQKYSTQMYQDYWQDRKDVLSKDSKYANTSFVILANNNTSRTRVLVEKLQAQDIEIFVADKDIKVKKAKNHLGQTLDTTVPAGSLVIPNRQPEARLIAAILEFEAALLPEVITEERQKVLKDGSSIMYDTTAWNLSMMYGLDALTVPQYMQRDLTPYQNVDSKPQPGVANAIAWAVNGDDDAALAFAARLMEQGVQVRAINKATSLGEVNLSRGSVVVTSTDNPKQADLLALINATATDVGLDIQSISTGYGTGDTPEWGGEHFVLLTRPQIAVASQAGTSSNDVGATWFSLDSNLGIRHSHLDSSALSRTDLRRYNVLIMPSAWQVSSANAAILRDWVKQGGTLITHDAATSALLKQDDFSNIALVEDIAEDAQEFDIALQRRLLAQQTVVDSKAIYSHQLPMDVSYPWQQTAKPLDKDELKKRDDWQSMFMPSGAMVAGSVDQEHWLSFGVNPTLPLLYTDQAVMIVPQEAQAVVTVGVYRDAVSKKADVDKETEAQAWYSMAPDKQLFVRMSGLLWPEAAQRIANSAYLSREQIGAGQVIMFSGEPNFRGASLGTNRLLLNAVVFGPGMGTRAKINL